MSVVLEIGIERLPLLCGLGVGTAANSFWVIMDVSMIRYAIIKLSYEVGPANAFQLALYCVPLLWFVPEEEHALLQFLSRGVSTEYRFKRIRVEACIESRCADGHWSWREILYLLEMEIQILGDDSQLGHVFFMASWVTADEVGDELLVEMSLFVDLVKQLFEIIEKFERWLAHEFQHSVGCILRCHLQSAAHMLGDQLARILHGSLVGFLVLALMEDKIVAYATSNEAFLYSRQCIDSVIYVEQLAVVCDEIWAYFRIDA